MLWFTNEQILSLPALAGADPASVPQMVADAGTVYAYLSAHSGSDDGPLRAWAEGAGIPPERFNAAMALLQQAGKALALSAGGAPVMGLAAGFEPALAAGLSEAFTAQELGIAAGKLGLTVAKSATKDVLAQAVATALLS